MDLKSPDMTALLEAFRGRTGAGLADTPPQFRLDVLASNICERLIAAQSNPVLHALYYNVRPLLDRELTKALGPVGMRTGPKSERKNRGRKNRAGGGSGFRAHSPQGGTPYPSGCGGRGAGDGPRYMGDSPVIDAEFWPVEGEGNGAGNGAKR